MSTVVLIPVLNRPEAAEPVALSVLETSPADVLFLVSPWDKRQLEACQKLVEEHARVFYRTTAWEPGPGDYAKKINLGFNWTTHDWLFQGADDLKFHAGWHDHCMAMSQHGSVIGTNDLCNPTTMRGVHSTHSLVSRSYIDNIGGGWDGPGVLLHEGYDHQYVDNELVTAAKRRRTWVFARNAHVEHMHWLCGKGQRDETSSKAFSGGRDDGRLYRERLKLVQRLGL